MLTPTLLEGGAGALVIFASLQWGLSGRAVKLASTSQELLDLFEALAWLEKEMVVPPFGARRARRPGNSRPAQEEIPSVQTHAGQGPCEQPLCSDHSRTNLRQRLGESFSAHAARV
jgi:hypothetical protein